MDAKYVIKRDGRRQPLQLDKLTARLKKLADGLSLSEEHCNPGLVAEKVIKGAYSGIDTDDLDKWAAVIAHQIMAYDHEDYDTLAVRIAVSNLHKNTNKSFSEAMKIIHNEGSGLIADDVYQIIIDNAARLDEEIVHERDFDYDYLMFKNIEGALLRVKGEVVERPQYMWMRASVERYKVNSIDSIIKGYHWITCDLHLKFGHVSKKTKTSCSSWKKREEVFLDHELPWMFEAPPMSLYRINKLLKEDKVKVTTVAIIGGIEVNEKGWNIFECISEDSVLRYKIGLQVYYDQHISTFTLTDTQCEELMGYSAQDLSKEMKEVGYDDVKLYPHQLVKLLGVKMAFEVEVNPILGTPTVSRCSIDSQLIGIILGKMQSTNDVYRR